MLPEIKQLLDLQTIDAQRADASARIDRLQRDLKRLHDAIEEEKSLAASVQDALRELQHNSRMKNLEVDELDSQIRDYQKRLDEGIISFKEMEDLRAKISLERTRIDQLEDDALSMMDSIETRTQEAEDAQTHLSDREATVQQQIRETQDHIDETRRQLAEMDSERVRTVEAAPAYLITQYESLHKRFGNPIAEIKNGTCTGCKLKVSGNTTERARGELGVVTCEHCSRVLYTL